MQLRSIIYATLTTRSFKYEQLMCLKSYSFKQSSFDVSKLLLQHIVNMVFAAYFICTCSLKIPVSLKLFFFIELYLNEKQKNSDKTEMLMDLKVILQCGLSQG